MKRRLALVGSGAVLVALALALAGCGKSPAATPVAGSGTPGASAPAGGGPTITVPDPATGGPTAPAPAGPATPPECRVPQLSIELAAGGAGSGHRSAVLVFRNTGGATCRMRGYPGVAGLDARGTQIEQARRTTSGYLGGLAPGAANPTVDLAPGQTASAMVESVAFGPDGNGCTAYAGLLVTPPDETHSVRVGWTGDGCSGLEIHPVVAGRTGSRS